jgi:two-component system, NarL family, sensor histidine kinase UhpB
VLCLGDDGKGIAPSAPKGFGLTAMTERVRSLGGSCVIESAPDKGAIIRIEIPVERAVASPQRAVATVKPSTAAKRAAELVEGLQ